MRKGSKKATKAKRTPTKRQFSTDVTDEEYRAALNAFLDAYSDRLELDLEAKTLTEDDRLLRIPYPAWNHSLE
jgi:hypothetical protein